MKEFNCPDCQKTDTCNNCTRYLNKPSKQLHVPPNFPDSILWPEDSHIQPACKTCGQHPSNGGDGICNCIAIYWDKDFKTSWH